MVYKQGKRQVPSSLRVGIGIHFFSTTYKLVSVPIHADILTEIQIIRRKPHDTSTQRTSLLWRQTIFFKFILFSPLVPPCQILNRKHAPFGAHVTIRALVINTLIEIINKFCRWGYCDKSVLGIQHAILVKSLTAALKVVGFRLSCNHTETVAIPIRRCVFKSLLAYFIKRAYSVLVVRIFVMSCPNPTIWIVIATVG